MLPSCLEIPIRLNRLPSALLGHAQRVVWITARVEYRPERPGQTFCRRQAEGLALLLATICDETADGLRAGPLAQNALNLARVFRY